MVAVVVGENRQLHCSGPNTSHTFGRILWHALVSIILIILGGWTVYHNWPLRSIRFDELEYSEQAADRLAGYPDAQYAYGMRAWSNQETEKAAGFFRQAVSQNVLFIDAWLRLAETQAAMGQEADAKAILEFVDRMTGPVLRWKWPELVLAMQLGLNEICVQNANFLLARNAVVQDTLQLLHTHFDGDSSAMLAVLSPSNLSAYLDWLMRWGMAEDSLAVWQAMMASAPVDKPIALRFAHFLLSHKRIDQSIEIWRQYTGSDGLINPGFEDEITNQGFDWRIWVEKEKNWELTRGYSESFEGNYALKLNFSGKENVSFQHLFQILAVIPRASYRLTYAWKTRGITTDQGPFMEIVGYDTPKLAPGLHAAGTMMSGTHGWQEDAIVFTIPDDCRAVVVRLRRKPSMRFDSKIRGSIWIDNFRLEKIGSDSEQFAYPGTHIDQ